MTDITQNDAIAAEKGGSLLSRIAAYKVGPVPLPLYLAIAGVVFGASVIGKLPAAVVGDNCVCVGPPDTIAMGSSTVLINNRPAARLGDTTAALAAFDKALAIDPDLPSTLSNAGALYLRIGDTQRAARLDARLRREYQHDPFYQFMQGVSGGAKLFHRCAD